MARVIYKYPLSGGEHVDGDGSFSITISVPRGFEPKFVGLQGGRPMLWAEVDTVEESMLQTFHIVGTGREIPKGIKYVGTVLDGSFVWHVYLE